MGNAMSPCFQQKTKLAIKVIFSDQGTTRLLRGNNKHIAGEIMFEFPDQMVCHADAFFIGNPLPALAIDDELMHGHTYFVLPIDHFACRVLSVSLLAALGSSSSPDKKAAPLQPINFVGKSPFEYIKASNGKVLIKVVPEFVTSLITRGNKTRDDNDDANDNGNGNTTSILCSTPELQKHYEQLVGPKEQLWSPKLETISEYRARFSPCKFIGLEWKLKEKEAAM